MANLWQLTEIAVQTDPIVQPGSLLEGNSTARIKGPVIATFANLLTFVFFQNYSALKCLWTWLAMTLLSMTDPMPENATTCNL